MDFDLVVIGGGSGGVRAARIAGGLGARVALVEAREMGGTCVNLGCVPKKLLAYAARYREHVEDAAGFGWSIPDPRLDWPALIAAKDREIARLNGIYERLLVEARVEIVRGWGRIRDPHSVEVGDRVLTTRRILIATGGKPWRPAQIRGAADASTSDDFFHMETLPERVVVVGGGYVAVELASILEGLGAETTLLYRGPLFLRGFDVELREALAEEMRKRGVEVVFDAPVVEVRTEGASQTAICADGSAYRADRVILCTGRSAGIEGIGLENVGLTADPVRGIPIDGMFRTAVPSIFAVGDVADRGDERHYLNLTPVALAEGMQFARQQFGGDGHAVGYDCVPTAVFASPNLSSVGMTEEMARERLRCGRVYVSRFRPMVHTMSGRNEKTLMKLIVDDTNDRVCGAHMLGPDAGEVIQGLAVAVNARVTKADLDRTIGIHPTAAEEFVTMRTPTRRW